MTPRQEDEIICKAADNVGIHDVTRRQVIDVNERELPAEYWRKSIDWAKVRRDLKAGVVIPGAQETDAVEYVLRRLP